MRPRRLLFLGWAAAIAATAGGTWALQSAFRTSPTHLSADVSCTTAFTEFTYGSVRITSAADGTMWFSEWAPTVGKIATDGTVTEFTVPGSSTANSSPQFIVQGPDGNMWFTDYTANRIDKITAAGDITKYDIPTTMTPPGPLGNTSGPTHILVGPDGNLWFYEWFADKIAKITPAGHITEYPRQTQSKMSIASLINGPDGNLWFSDLNNGKIGKITTDGAITEYMLPDAASAPQPHDLAVGGDGNIWFMESAGSKIGNVTTGGSFTEYPFPFSNPFALASDAAGNLWLAGQTQIIKVKTDGTITPYARPNNGFGTQLIKGNDGNIWFGDWSNHAIGTVTANGTVTEYVTPSKDSQPQAMYADAQNNIWFDEDNSANGRKIGVLHVACANMSLAVSSSSPPSSNSSSSPVQSSSIAQSSAAGGLLARYTFDDGTAADTSGNRANGVASGVAFQNGCAVFSGAAGGNIAIPNMDGETFSFSAWIKKEDGGLPNYPIIGGDGTGGWGIVFFNDDILNGGVSNASGPMHAVLTKIGYNGVVAKQTIAPGEFHHLAITHAADGTTLIYIDGVLSQNIPAAIAGNVTTTGNFGNGGKNYFLGALPNLGVGEAFKGTLDDVRIYGKVLTASDIASLAAIPASCAPGSSASSAVLASASSSSSLAVSSASSAKTSSPTSSATTSASSAATYCCQNGQCVKSATCTLSFDACVAACYGSSSSVIPLPQRAVESSSLSSSRISSSRIASSVAQTSSFPGTTAAALSSRAQTTCGNGRKEAGETCDDGNTTGGDGCSSNCTTEQGWVCAGTPSVCILPKTPAAAVSPPSSLSYLTIRQPASSAVFVAPPPVQQTFSSASFAPFAPPTAPVLNWQTFPVTGTPASSPATVRQTSSRIAAVPVFVTSSSSAHPPTLQAWKAVCGNARLEIGEECDLGSNNSDGPGSACSLHCTLPHGETLAAHAGAPAVELAPLQNGSQQLSPLQPASQQLAQVQMLQPSNGYAPQYVYPGAPLALYPPRTASSGPGSLAMMAAGAAGGFGWMRRKKR